MNFCLAQNSRRISFWSEDLDLFSTLVDTLDIQENYAQNSYVFLKPLSCNEVE